MAGNYYFIPDAEDLPDVVSNKNRTYEFQPVNIPVPFYIREGSNYRKITDDNLNIGGLQRYRLFQKVTSPNQIVEKKETPISTSPTDDTYQPYEPTPAEQLPPDTEPDDILVVTPTPSKPEEEPVYTDEPTEPGEPPHKPYKATRVTGPTPIQFSLPVEYNDDSDTDSAEDFVFDYEEAGMVASGKERSIGETWAWRIGQADHWWPNGGFTAKYYYEHPEAINNDNYWNPHGGDS